MDVQTVYRKEYNLGDIFYPMTSWTFRECKKVISYPSIDSNLTNRTRAMETLVCMGSTSGCHVIPKEDYTYINPTMKITGYVFLKIHGVLSIITMDWTIYFHERYMVKDSQTIFLVLIVFSCFILYLGIVSINIEGEYCYEHNLTTG